MPSMLHKVAKWLRRKFPTNTPVRVVVVKNLPGMYGLCHVTNEKAIIRISKTSEHMMAETLLEEWAHVLRHECPVPYEGEDLHDAVFWSILARITKEYRGE